MKNIKNVLIVLCFSFCLFTKSKGQSWALLLPSQNMCVNSYGYAKVWPLVSAATSYSWAISMLTATCFPIVETDSITGENILIKFPCQGSYQIFCNAYSNSSAFITQLSNTINVSSNTFTSIQPTVVSSSPGTICPGINSTISAIGGSIYNWQNNTTSNAIVSTSSPGVNSYFAVNTGSNACSSFNAKYILGSQLQLYIYSSLASNTVCNGSSIDLFAMSNSAISYTWNNNPSLNNFSLSTISNASVSGLYNYSVTITDSFGCTETATTSIYQNNNCAIVWPGDANRDGIVDNNDVFELGLNASSNGSARTSTSNSWVGVMATAWTGTTSTGWNLCHADCNGDGIINANDTVAIYNNYALNHAFKENENQSGPILQLIPQQQNAFMGEWNKIDVLLGDQANQVNQIYGLCFDINFDKTIMQQDSLKFYYTNSFLNSANQNINFRKLEFTNNKLHSVTVRTNHSNVSGFGKIGELWYKLNNIVPPNVSVNLSSSEIKTINAAGIKNTISSSNSFTQNVSTSVGLNKLNEIESSIIIYPNPIHDKLVISNLSKKLTNYLISDYTGRIIFTGSFITQTSINISELNQGIYFVQVETSTSKKQFKIIKE